MIPARFLVWLARVRAWLFDRRETADLHDEVETHLALLSADYERRGLPPDEAARRARLDFGGVAQFKEHHRERRGLPWLDEIVQDIGYGLRLFRREPTFTAGAVLTLAIGIGANTTVFSLINGYLRPLPVPAPADVVAIGGESRGDESAINHTMSYPVVQDLRARRLPFTDVFAYTPWIGGLHANGRVTSFLFSAVTDNYFTGLQLEPALGRFFRPGEGDHPGAPRLVVLGYTCWQRRFGGDPTVIDRVVRIDGVSATVIGVVPKRYLGLYAGTEMEGYVTIDTLTALDRAQFGKVYDRWDVRMFTVYARLQPGTSIVQAQQAVDIAAGEIERAHPDLERNRGMRVFPERLARPFPQRTLASVMPIVTMFVLGLAMVVLALACMNVSNLVFVRALARQREMAVRAAIGASRARLIRQSITESLLLAAAGGLAGVMLGRLGQRLFMAGIDIGTDFQLVVNFDFDWRVFLYALTAATATGVTVGLWPALRASPADARAMLHDGGRSSSGGRQRLRRLLVVAQVAGALMLLTVAGLFVRHLIDAQHLDLGFDATHVLNARLDPHQLGYDDARTKNFYRELTRRVRAWPEVTSASLAFSVPLGYFDMEQPVYADGQDVMAGEPPPSFSFNTVGAGYFETMGIPVLQGRPFRDSDEAAGARVVVVNETLAERFWPGQSPIGRYVRLGRPDSPPWQVIGLARDSKYVLIFEHPRPYIYTPLDQEPKSMRVLQVRTAVPPAAMASRLEREIHAIDTDMPIADLQTMQASLSGAMGFLLYRLGAYQAGALGILGLALAIVGVYGVVSYSASQRTREIGIRVALGAHPRDIARLILRQGAGLVAAGLAAGTVGAALVTPVMARFSTISRTTDVWTMVIVSTVLAVIALWACALPARRAMRVDPITALRHE